MIRRAEEKDIEGINVLLSQVLEIHAKIRPDIFIPGTTKYKDNELKDIIHNDATPIFLYVDDENNVLGHAFLKIQSSVSNNIKPIKSLYIDDLCVNEDARGLSIGRKLMDFIKDYAKEIGCYHITLNVWEGNDLAKHFYNKMGFGILETKMEYIIK